MSWNNNVSCLLTSCSWHLPCPVLTTTGHQGIICITCFSIPKFKRKKTQWMGIFSPENQPGRQNESETLKVWEKQDMGKEKCVARDCFMDRQMEEVVKRPRELWPVGFLFLWESRSRLAWRDRLGSRRWCAGLGIFTLLARQWRCLSIALISRVSKINVLERSLGSVYSLHEEERDWKQAIGRYHWVLVRGNKIVAMGLEKMSIALTFVLDSVLCVCMCLCVCACVCICVCVGKYINLQILSNTWRGP